MPVPVPPSEPRTREQLRQHYELERDLARRLKNASSEARRQLYGEVYDELLERLPDQPMLRQKADPEARAGSTSLQHDLLRPFLTSRTRFLEVGAGDTSLARALAPSVRNIVVVEASRRILGKTEFPENLRVVHGDATTIDLPEGAIDLAYSCHFLEHLHPSDAVVHLSEIHRILASGGVYVLVTPNRLWGPHDISRYFDDEPRGLHLREYGYGELVKLLRQAGFHRWSALRGIGRRPSIRSTWPHRAAEKILDLLPKRFRRPTMEWLFREYSVPFRPLEQVKVAGWK